MFVLLFFIPLIYGLEECQRQEEPRDIPCYLVTGWDPTNACNTYNLTVYNETGDDQYIQVMGDIGTTGRCNATFNLTIPGQYYANTTIDSWNILVEREDNMTSLGIILFLILINIALFVTPFRVRFVEDELANELWKRIIWMFGVIILAFNITIFTTLANNFGLGINRELFVFQRFVLWSVPPFLIYLFWRAVVSGVRIARDANNRKRMGEDE